MFAELRMQVWAVKPYCHGCFPLELLLCIPTKWNQTINSGFRMMVFVATQIGRPTDKGHSVMSVVGSISQLWQSSHSQRMLSLELLSEHIVCSSLTSAVCSKLCCRRTGTCFWTNYSIGWPSCLWVVYTRFGSQAIIKGCFHSSLYFEHCRLNFTASH
jgi:hypothetical protein